MLGQNLAVILFLAGMLGLFGLLAVRHFSRTVDCCGIEGTVIAWERHEDANDPEFHGRAFGPVGYTSESSSDPVFLVSMLKKDGSGDYEWVRVVAESETEARRKTPGDRYDGRVLSMP